jgi:hypothetical protein
LKSACGWPKNTGNEFLRQKPPQKPRQKLRQ